MKIWCLAVQTVIVGVVLLQQGHTYAQGRTEDVVPFWKGEEISLEGGYYDEDGFFLGAGINFARLNHELTGDTDIYFNGRINFGYNIKFKEIQWGTLQPSLAFTLDDGQPSGLGSFAFKINVSQFILTKFTAMVIPKSSSWVQFGGRGEIAIKPVDFNDKWKLVTIIAGQLLPRDNLVESKVQVIGKLYDCTLQVGVGVQGQARFLQPLYPLDQTWFAEGRMGLVFNIWRLPGQCDKEKTLIH